MPVVKHSRGLDKRSRGRSTRWFGVVCPKESQLSESMHCGHTADLPFPFPLRRPHHSCTQEVWLVDLFECNTLLECLQRVQLRVHMTQHPKGRRHDSCSLHGTLQCLPRPSVKDRPHLDGRRRV